jgi:hypothetical protein
VVDGGWEEGLWVDAVRTSCSETRGEGAERAGGHKRKTGWKEG